MAAFVNSHFRFTVHCPVAISLRITAHNKISTIAAFGSSHFRFTVLSLWVALGVGELLLSSPSWMVGMIGQQLYT